MAKGYRVPFWGEEDVLRLIVVMGAHFCEYKENHGIVHFKWVNYNDVWIISQSDLKKYLSKELFSEHCYII